MDCESDAKIILLMSVF